LHRYIDLCSDLTKKEDELEKVEKCHQEAEVLADLRAKELENLRAALLDFMKEAMVLIDNTFKKGETDPSEALPDADLLAFSGRLCTEIGQFERLLFGVSDLGAYGAALDLTRTF
jgi:hypothetical protein